MKLSAMIICHKNMLHQNKNIRSCPECTLSKSLLCSHIPEKLGDAHLTTTASASSLGGVIFVAAKYDVFRNGAVSS
jgi:hypothetical protein